MSIPYTFHSEAVESYLHKSKSGHLGVTGEGSLLDNAIGQSHHSY